MRFFLLCIYFAWTPVKGIDVCARMMMNENEIQALSDLRLLLFTEKEWIKVHAAEFLLGVGHDVDEVKAVFMGEEKRFANIPKYRIGIWRVLVQAANDEEERRQWIAKIVECYQDTAGADRLHAIETLAKLHYPVEPDTVQLPQLEKGDGDVFSIYRLWNAAYHQAYGRQRVQRICLDLIRNPSFDQNLLPNVSYLIRFLGPISLTDWQLLCNFTAGLEGNSAVHANFLATAWIVAPPDAPLTAIKSKLLGMATDRSTLVHVFTGLAKRGTSDEEKILMQLFKRVSDRNAVDYDADIHAYGAHAVVMLCNRL